MRKISSILSAFYSTAKQACGFFYVRAGARLARRDAKLMEEGRCLRRAPTVKFVLNLSRTCGVTLVVHLRDTGAGRQSEGGDSTCSRSIFSKLFISVISIFPKTMYSVSASTVHFYIFETADLQKHYTKVWLP